MSKDNVEIAAFVGLDWADEKHAVTLQEAGSDKRHGSTLEHTPEGTPELDSIIARSFRWGRPVAIAVEQKRGALIYALMHVDFLHLYPVNPVTVAKMREAFYPSGAKDDPNDADLLLDILMSHRRHLRVWTPDDALTRSIQLLTEDRRHVVDERTALTNQLTGSAEDVLSASLGLVWRPAHRPSLRVSSTLAVTSAVEASDHVLDSEVL
jgi:hypothetical protein